MRAPNRNSRGYSLIELLTVMAIIGVLSLITVPSFISFQRAGKMKSALRNFTMDLRTLRQRAIAQNVWTRMEIRPATSETTASRSYTFSQSDDRGLTWTALAMRGGFGGNATAVVGGGTGNVKELEKAVFIAPTPPVTAGGPPRTFTDLDSNGSLDIIFRPNGTCMVPTANVDDTNVTPNIPASGDVMLRTQWNVTNNLIRVSITPSGRIHTTATHV